MEIPKFAARRWRHTQGEGEREREKEGERERERGSEGERERILLSPSAKYRRMKKKVTGQEIEVKKPRYLTKL